MEIIISEISISISSQSISQLIYSSE